MDNAFASCVAAGGPWTQSLFAGAMLWALTVSAAVVVQRRQLARLVEQTVAATPDDEHPDRTVERFRGRLGPLTGGAIGLALALSWWALAAAALVWSLAAGWDLTRLNDEAYLASRYPGTSIGDMARILAATLITRAAVGSLSAALALPTVLAIDQMWLRPRTRLLDELRLRLVRADTNEDLLAELQTRADARWSWAAFVFGWLWLVFKKQKGRAWLFAGLNCVLGIALGLVYQHTDLSFGPRRDLPSGQTPTAMLTFWQPLLGTSLILPAYVLALVVAVRGTGWAAASRSR